MKFNNKIYAEIGEFITIERKKIDLTQKELADISGCSRVSITNLELGKPFMPFYKIEKILNSLGYAFEIEIINIK